MKQKQGLVTKEDLERLATKEQLDRVAIQVGKNSEAINKMVTREEFDAAQREVLSGQDKMMTILQRLDQERIFTASRLGE